MNTEPDLETDKPGFRYQFCHFLVRELWAHFRFYSHLYKMGIITIANKSYWVSNTMVSVTYPSCLLVLTASLRTRQLRYPFEKKDVSRRKIKGPQTVAVKINEGKCFTHCLATVMAAVVIIIDPFVKTVQYPSPIIYSFLGIHPCVLSLSLSTSITLQVSFLCEISLKSLEDDQCL